MSSKDSDLIKTMTLVISALVVFFVIIVIAALVVSGSGESANTEKDPRIAAKVNELIQAVGKVNVEASADSASAAPAAGGSIDAVAEFQNRCFACHGTGAAGAPKVGDKAAWKDRIAAGKDSLYKNALNGKGAMPPRGGHASLSDDAIKAIVDYMVSKSK